MRVLALDSTTRGGSVALLDDARLVEERAGDSSRSHAERLPGELTRLLADHDLAFADVDLFAVASGPGSFTGLRIGIATMQGLALVRQRPLAGVSALDALAVAGAAAATPGEVIAVWMDAHRKDVFAALYNVERADSDGLQQVSEADGPSVGDPAATLLRWRAGGVCPSLIIGGGAILYAESIAQAIPAARIEAPPLLASFIGRLALARALSGEAHHPAALQPLYVRRPDAEVARDRQQGRSQRP